MRLFRALSYICLLVVMPSCCGPYRNHTHLGEEELEWVTNRYIGETMRFQSQVGIVDTIIITEIDIQNSTDTIDREYYYHNIGDGNYYAGCDVYFSLRGRKGRDGLNLYKDTNEIVCFWMEFLDVLTVGSPLVDTCIQIDSMVLDDILFFEEKYCEVINRYHHPNPITSLAWSKKYGLVQYTFQDGTVFNRIDLK